MFLYATKGQIDALGQTLERVRPFIRDEGWLARNEALMLIVNGRYGDAYTKARVAIADQPDSQIPLLFTMLRLGLDEALLAMESGPPFFRLFALLRLDRREEALRLAQQWSERPGQPSLMIQFYHATSQPRKLLDYVETQWADTKQFAAEFPGAPMFGNSNLFQLANAYRLSGQPEKFEQALGLARQDHDRALKDGFDSQFNHFAESSYWAIAGDAGKALDHLEFALDRGGSFPLSDLPLIPEWRELHDEPRFRELAERAHQRFNEQRAVAGLDPYEAEWPL
jgi:hypothetical protein